MKRPNMYAKERDKDRREEKERQKENATKTHCP